MAAMQQKRSASASDERLPISRLIHASESPGAGSQAEHRALMIGAPSRNHRKKLLHIRD
jgi:hypothetical protein